jgi:hypothetical protein
VSILDNKYQIRKDGETPTLVWINEEGKKRVKPATPAETHLVYQVNGLIVALEAAMKRNAIYETRSGSKAKRSS